jgi:ubiquitin C-terminal hydrolase
LQNAERSTILQTAPEYLILSLNRFEYDKQTNVFRKVFTKMDYPKVLDVHVHPSRTSPVRTRYCLVLIIVHTGYTLHGGHYYVYAREIKPSDLSTSNQDDQKDRLHNDEWFLFNDDLVTSSSYEAIMENCAQYTSATPYVLFYQRMDKIEGIKQIHIHQSLIEQIHKDNISYERESDK